MSQWIRDSTRLGIYIRDGFRCVYCGRSARELRMGLTLDHLVPVSLGGSNAPSNLVTCCRSCNSSRRALPLWQFVADLPDLEDCRRRVRNAQRSQLPRQEARALLLERPKWLRSLKRASDTRGHGDGDPSPAERFHLPAEAAPHAA